MSKVVVYTKDYCPYCNAVKSLLAEKGVEFEEVDVTNNQEALNEMLSKSEGRTTVPEIFIDDVLVGGFDDLKAKEDSGELDKLLGL